LTPAEPKNGANLNRQLKATEAYANLNRDIKLLHVLLFGNNDDGAIPVMRQSLERLEQNPMIQFGYFVRTGKRAAASGAIFLAACATIALGTIQAGKFLGLWP
jgi:hypothetical protein